MLSQRKGLPGLTRVDHFGLTVPDLDKATTFLVDVLGCEYLYSLGPFVHESDWMQVHLNVHPRAVMKELRFFSCGGEAVFEVFEDFRYVREIGAADAADHALVFRTRIGAREIEGCDFLHRDENGAITELTVMVRPLNGALALAETMKAKLAGG